jgi:hypothetical protein
MLQIVASLTDDSKGIIYDCSMFITQATSGTGIRKDLFPEKIQDYFVQQMNIKIKQSLIK